MNVDWVVSSSILILMIVLVRVVFRNKIRPHVRYIMWLAVALRLLIPFSFWKTDVSILNFIPEQMKFQSDGRDISITEQFKRTEVHTEQSDTLKEQRLPDGQGPESDLLLSQMENQKQYDLAVDETAKQGGILWNMQLWHCWFLGVVLCMFILLAVNLDYGRRLKQSRRQIAGEMLPDDLKIPVYISEMVQTPCLFGLFHPCIYVTDDVRKEKSVFHFVLCHENVHYKHHDNWWIAVRALCLCLHWYNPLVWLAVYLSREDGELSCDESVLKILGDEMCVDYGRALLELGTAKASGISGWRMSSMIRGNRRILKERLQMIVNMPEETMGVRILFATAAVFAVLITFTGRNPIQEIADYSMAQWRRNYSQAFKNVEDLAEDLSVKDDEILMMDLNFDGWDDLCIQRYSIAKADIPYDCMLWNPETGSFEYSATLYNVEAEAENEWICSRMYNGEEQCSETYYRYDIDNHLHMVRYVEKSISAEGESIQLDLTYEENGSRYALPAIADENNLDLTLIYMAKQTISELEQWMGAKVETACFLVTDAGGVILAESLEDMDHSRVFCSRYFGADTEYNLSGYDKSISSVSISSGKEVWYSQIFWRNIPENINMMTDVEVIIWYFEQLPMVSDVKVKTIEQRYPGMWTIQTENAEWFEVFYDPNLQEISNVTGPYPSCPEH